jgi:hypothetical protein
MGDLKSFPRQDEDCVDYAIKPPNKPNHRRAATNFIPNVFQMQEAGDLRTLQPHHDPYINLRKEMEVDCLYQALHPTTEARDPYNKRRVLQIC